ncbi:MAG: methionine synthase, partial [Propionibacteriaceae bacterium]|nr:methionine synthase [Propionibacteriaceae bacterium]
MRATGLGSWPGADMAAAAGQVAEAFPDDAFLPELPARGPAAQMIGRALGLIDGLAFEAGPAGWATAARPSGAH